MNKPVALVTGGGSGIGQAVALQLKDDYTVVVVGRREAPLKETAASCGGDWICADLAVREQVDACVAEVVQRHGRLDGVVLNAGTVHEGSIEAVSYEDWDDTLRVNLTSPFWVVKAAIPHLLKASGALVSIASAAALHAAPQLAAYGASKAALVMLTQSIAVDFGRRGVRANALCPGWTRTEMADRELGAYGAMTGLTLEEAYRKATSLSPLGRPADAVEIARLVRWLLSSEASFVNGAVIPIDGGASAVDPGSIALAL